LVDYETERQTERQGGVDGGGGGEKERKRDNLRGLGYFIGA